MLYGSLMIIWDVSRASVQASSRTCSSLPVHWKTTYHSRTSNPSCTLRNKSSTKASFTTSTTKERRTTVSSNNSTWQRAFTSPWSIISNWLVIRKLRRFIECYCFPFISIWRCCALIIWRRNIYWWGIFLMCWNIWIRRLVLLVSCMRFVLITSCLLIISSLLVLFWKKH